MLLLEAANVAAAAAVVVVVVVTGCLRLCPVMLRAAVRLEAACSIERWLKMLLEAAAAAALLFLRNL